MHLHHYILWHFANYAHHKTLYMHLAYSCTLNNSGDFRPGSSTFIMFYGLDHACCWT